MPKENEAEIDALHEVCITTPCMCDNRHLLCGFVRRTPYFGNMLFSDFVIYNLVICLVC